MPRRAAAVAALLLGAAGHMTPHRNAAIDFGAMRVDRHAAVKISVASSPVIDDGGCVNVTFTAPSPVKDDWVAATDATLDPTSYSPIEWMMASASPTYLSSGTGALTFCLVNMRAPYSFVLCVRRCSGQRRAGDAVVPGARHW
jgi:hypothetical protein